MEHKKICEGVLQVSEKGDRTFSINDKKYVRLMDYFYIEVPADELSLEQVTKLCQARVHEKRCFNGANKIIKTLFGNFLKQHSKKSVWEIGAGTNPILTLEEAEKFKIAYSTSDADQYDGLTFQFDADTELSNQQTFDVVIALFVLHFRFYEHQIAQIFQHIKQDGVFLANVYNRSEESRRSLKSDFERAGFKVEFIEDTKNICRNNYYLLASKSSDVIEKNKLKLLELIEAI